MKKGLRREYEIVDETVTSLKTLAQYIFELDMMTGQTWHYERLGYGLGRIVRDP